MFKPAITEKATRLGKICDCDLTEKGVIKKQMVFPKKGMYGIDTHMGKFMENLTMYNANGGNANDDAPDSLGMVASEIIEENATTQVAEAIPFIREYLLIKHSIKKSLRMITGVRFGSNASSINRVGGFDGIGANYDTQNIDYNKLEYNYIPNIEISDIINQFNMLATLKAGVTASIYLTTEQNAQINDEKKAIATNKGWTINVKNS